MTRSRRNFTLQEKAAIGYVTPHTKLAGRDKSSLPSEMKNSKPRGKEEGFGEPRRYKTLSECPDSIRFKFI